MKVLIVGAGVAGLTLAALLKRLSFDVTVVEKKADVTHDGYTMGLYPIGSKILYELNLMPDYLEHSVEIANTAVCKQDGSVIQRLALGEVFSNYGSRRGFSRASLLRVLLKSCQTIPIKTETSVTSLVQQKNKVRVKLTDGSAEIYDLVVGADGIHSAVRQLAFPSEECQYYNTGWGGWVWSADEPRLAASTVTEFWGAGSFLGVYPTEDKWGVLALAPTQKGKTEKYSGRRQEVLDRFPKLVKVYPELFASFPDDDAKMFYWPLTDVRTRHWYKNRVVLVGDAAAGFLPTTGIGASMALESAAVLADELSRTDSQYVDWALDLYEKRRKKRVESIQNDSRRLARFMLVSSPLMAAVRDFSLNFYSVKRIAKNIAKNFKLPI